MDIIKKAREFARDIQSTQEYKKYCIAKIQHDEDFELQELIGKINLLKIELDALVSSENKDDKAIKEKNKQITKIYSMVMKNSSMQNLKEKEQDFKSIMYRINTILYYCSNGYDPDTCPDETAGCSGDCNGCSGCS